MNARDTLVSGRITMGRAVIIKEISPKERKLTPRFINHQRVFLKITRKGRVWCETNKEAGEAGTQQHTPNCCSGYHNYKESTRGAMG